MTTHTTDHQPRTRLALFGAFVLATVVLALVALVGTPGSDAQGSSIVINEIQPGNVATLADGDGGFEDWIELRNTTNADIDIAGWRIDDSTGSWTVTVDPLRPERTIVPANGFLLVWASDKGDPLDDGFPGPADELHASFKLSRTSDSVTLTNGFTVVDTLSYGPADVPAGFDDDESYGLNDAGNFVVFTPVDVTPLAPNGEVTVPTPIPIGPASIVINEVMQGNQTTIADGDLEFEDWFELYNPTCEAVDLTGWTVRDSAEEWQLPDATILAPGDLLFLWASNKGDPDNVDQFPGPAGELHTNFRLSLAGEDLLLLNNDGEQIAFVNPGPSAVDESYGLTSAGDYVTLTGADISPEALNPGQAVPVCIPTPTPTPTPLPTSTPTPTPTPTPLPTPTPGGPTPTATPVPAPTPTAEECTARLLAPNVVINEAQSRNTFTIRDGDGDFEDWLELYNPTDATIDVSGWTLRSSGSGFNDTTFRWELPEGVTIASGEYVLVWASRKGLPEDPDFPGPDGELHAADFLLIGSRSGFLSLSDTDDCLIDGMQLLPLENDESYGFTPEGTFDFGQFDVGWATPGEPNGPQRATPEECASRAAVPSIVINEAQSLNTFTIADGDGDYSDWIELFNPTDATIDLSGWLVKDTANQWRLPFLDPATGTRIPGQVTIASGEYLLIWASGKGLPADPAFPGPADEFHTQYQLSNVDGELVSVTDFDGCVIDELAMPPLDADESFGLIDDGTPGSFDRRYATPGEPNGAQGITPEECAARVAAQGIVINEAQSRNSLTITDGDGDYSDWLELFNPTDATVDVSGWFVNDTSNQWQFPFTFDPTTGGPVPDQVTIASGEYVLIWASGKALRDDPDFPGPAGEFHTQFRLSGSEGESLSLEDFDGCVMSELNLPSLADSESYGITSDGTPGRFNRGYPTPLEENGNQALPVRSVCYAPESDVRLNRIVARNNGLLLDADGDDGDFIELLNTGLNEVDLSLWQISDESDRSIIPGDTVIAPGATLILWASGKGDIFDDDYPGPAGEIHLTFRLAGGGEQLTFAEPSECIVEQFTYPELQSNQSYGYDAQNQRVISAAAILPGEIDPGETEIVCAATGSVQIAAISAKTDAGRADEDGDNGDWLELRNTTDAAIDLSGWILADDGNTWIVPDGVVITPDTDLLVWSDEKDRGGADTPLHTSFKLSAGGETVTVSSAPECPVDVVAYPEVDDDEIYRRAADGTFTLEANAAASDDDEQEGDPSDISITGACIAINEVMAKNDGSLEDDDGEFGDWIELVNLSDETLDLSGYAIADFSDSWTFPDGVEIEAGEFLIVWADEQDRGEAGEELHTNFKLGSGGELITVTNTEGDIVARMSAYPELDDDQSFGVNDEGDYVVFDAGDATPGAGPVNQGCDFEVRVANASAVDDDTPDSADGDDDAEGDDGDEDADAANDEADDADTAASTNLALTGSNTHVQGLLAQLFILSGFMMVLMAHIARRRSDT